MEYRRAQKLVCTVTLEKTSKYSNATAVPASTPYEGYWDGLSYWGAFSVEEQDGLPKSARAARTYVDGLLRQVEWLDQSGAVKTVKIDYYPDRSLLRERTWLRGERIDQRLYHNAEALPAPPPRARPAVARGG